MNDDNVIPFPTKSVKEEPANSFSEEQSAILVADFNTVQEIMSYSIEVIQRTGTKVDPKMEKDLEAISHFFFATIRRHLGEHLLHVLLDDAADLIKYTKSGMKNDSD